MTLTKFGKSGDRLSTSSPPQQEEGWPRHQEEAAKPPLMERTGWCGQEILDHTTLAARANVASRHFLIAHPPLLLLRRGARGESVPRFPSPKLLLNPSRQFLHDRPAIRPSSGVQVFREHLFLGRR